MNRYWTLIAVITLLAGGLAVNDIGAEGPALTSNDGQVEFEAERVLPNLGPVELISAQYGLLLGAFCELAPDGYVCELDIPQDRHPQFPITTDTVMACFDADPATPPSLVIVDCEVDPGPPVTGQFGAVVTGVLSCAPTHLATVVLWNHQGTAGTEDDATLTITVLAADPCEAI